MLGASISALGRRTRLLLFAHRRLAGRRKA